MVLRLVVTEVAVIPAVAMAEVVAMDASKRERHNRSFVWDGYAASQLERYRS